MSEFSEGKKRERENPKEMPMTEVLCWYMSTQDSGPSHHDAGLFSPPFWIIPSEELCPSFVADGFFYVKNKFHHEGRKTGYF